MVATGAWVTQLEILVVDDDPSLREVVRYALAREGWTVHEASDGQEALEAADRLAPDLLVLDVMMPELDGLEVCRRVRVHSDVPIVFLSSRAEEIDRVLGLELGGDDYLPKPFSPRELVSRIKAVMRRARGPAPVVEEGASRLAAGIRLDLDEHRAWVGEQEVELTVTEFRLLGVLMRRPGRVYTRDELVEHGYPDKNHVSDRTLDSHIRRIRAKLREVGLDPVETVHGLGFRLKKD